MRPLGLPAELSPDKTERLRVRPEAAEALLPVEPAPRRRGPQRHIVRLGKRMVRALLGAAISAELRGYVNEPRELAHAAQRRIDEIEQQVAGLQRRSLEVELVEVEVHAATVNFELLKGEVRSVVQSLEKPTAAPQSALFDYVGFERRFRGDPEEIATELAKRYLDLLVPNPPVVDIGCGRAELVELLNERGIEAIGVDTDPSMVAESRGRGLDVRLVDGSTFLRSCEPGSIGSIIATQVVEHLEFADLVQLLELAVSRLKPGGVLIAETPNPGSLIVLGTTYILDPTHLRPLHPALLTFLCEGAGFRDVQVRYYAPATYYHLPLIEDPDAPAWTGQVNEAFSRLNSVLFGPQDYAIVATTPPAGDAGDAAVR